MPLEFSFTYVWLILAVLLAILEINTTALVCIWFVIGSIFAFATSFITDSVIIQLVMFIVVSGVSLVFTRPFITKHLNKKAVPTNRDMIVGRVCIVTEKIVPGKKGRVEIDGLSWLAESSALLEKGEKAEIQVISGVTLTVQPITVKTN